MPDATPLLSVCMAHLDDYSGVWSTIQAIRLEYPDLRDKIEFIVSDNGPVSRNQQGKEIRSRASTLLRGDPSKPADRGLSGKIPQLRVIPFTDYHGTAAAKNHAIAHARGEYILAVDCHVLLFPGVIDRLLSYYREHPDTNDLYTGILVYDDFRTQQTHLDDRLRGGMWGTWGLAWGCECNGPAFSITHDPPDKRANVRRLVPGYEPVAHCRCGKEFPRVAWHGHERHFRAAGFRPKTDDNDPPFEIPGMGMFLFSCRREAWPGFHPEFRGFGGEESYISGVFRQRGDRHLCLPWLKAVHRFGRDVPVSHAVVKNYDKVRNLVIGRQALGLPIDDVRRVFIDDENLIPVDQWEHLIADPSGHREPPAKSGAQPAQTAQKKTGCGNCQQQPSAPQDVASLSTLDDAFLWLQTQPRDLEQHMPQLRGLASQVAHVTEFTDRRESTIAFLAAGPQTLISYTTDYDDLVQKALHWTPPELTVSIRPNQRTDQADLEAFAETDLLFIDSPHAYKTYPRLLWELTQYAPQVRRWIVLHDTHVYGSKGTDGGPGLVPAIAKFLKAFPQWFVASHTDRQHGLTVLGCQERDRPQAPAMFQNKTIEQVEIPEEERDRLVREWQSAGGTGEISPTVLSVVSQLAKTLRAQPDQTRRSLELAAGITTLLFARHSARHTAVVREESQRQRLLGLGVPGEMLDTGWQPRSGQYYDAILVHDLEASETLFESVTSSLAPNGRVLVTGTDHAFAARIAQKLGLQHAVIGKDQDQVQILTPPPKPLGDGPGTALTEMFKERGFPACQQCLNLAHRMNDWGAEGCRERLDEIVTDILPRARAWLKAKMPWAKSLFGAIKLEDTILKHEIKKHVTAAIDAAEEKDRERSESVVSAS